MSLTLHHHPLSSFCWKALIGLYELELPFDKHLVDLSDPAARAALSRLWPLVKFPVLRDDARDRTVPESSVLLEYAEGLAGGARRLLPADPTKALECRLRDRVYDLHVHAPMGRVVADRLRPAEARDAFGVARAKAELEAGFALVEGWARGGGWALGDEFTLADCSAFPALFYGDKVAPIAGRFPHLEAYLARLKARPSVARVLDEAQPYLAMFPGAT